MELTLKEWLALLVLVLNALLSFLSNREARSVAHKLDVLNGQQSAQRNSRS